MAVWTPLSLFIGFEDVGFYKVYLSNQMKKKVFIYIWIPPRWYLTHCSARGRLWFALSANCRDIEQRKSAADTLDDRATFIVFVHLLNVSS